MSAVVPDADYYRIIREICDEYNILFIVDEVMSGFHRTGRAFAFEHDGVEPDLIVAWPTAEISVMGPEGMLGIAGGKLLKAAEDPEAMKAQLVEMIKGYITPYQVARLGLVDEVIDPRETRNILLRGLEMTRNKHVERPHKRHGVSP